MNGEKMEVDTRAKMRISFLSVPEFFRLDVACRPLFDAFDTPPYLVGSCMNRDDFRDVDVSLMLADEKYDVMFPNKYAQLFLNASVSEWLSARTGLNIDFKFQDMTKANEEHKGPRNPLGIRGDSFKVDPPR